MSTEQESELSKIETITKYRTSDGKEFFGLNSAQDHASRIVQSERANEVLNSGGTVSDALRAAGWEAHIDPIFDKVNKDTKLVVEYWQCRETPGYQVRHFEPNHKVYVFGNAGSWSGSYGGTMELRELARYAKDKRTVFTTRNSGETTISL